LVFFMKNREQFLPAPHAFFSVSNLITVNFLARFFQIIMRQKRRLADGAKGMDLIVRIRLTATRAFQMGEVGKAHGHIQENDSWKRSLSVYF
jgi:hypothetical protein